LSSGTAHPPNPSSRRAVIAGAGVAAAVFMLGALLEMVHRNETPTPTQQSTHTISAADLESLLEQWLPGQIASQAPTLSPITDSTVQCPDGEYHDGDEIHCTANTNRFTGWRLDVVIHTNTNTTSGWRVDGTLHAP
jgi:hypothetical protein